MDYLAPTACADAYSDAATLGPRFQADHANIQVGASTSDTNAVLYQVAKGKPGDWRWTDEREFEAIPQTFRVGGGIIGIRFRNAVAGQVATVQAYLLGKRDPDVQPGYPFGIIKVAPTRTIITASGAWTPSLDVLGILFECTGAGGGGGGVPYCSSTQAAVAAGGGGGGYSALYVTGADLLAEYDLTVGSGGSPGSNGGSAGSSGGDTQVVDPTIGTILCQAGGGAGGVGAAATSAYALANGPGGGGGLGGYGDVRLRGEQGGYGLISYSDHLHNVGGKGGDAARGGKGAWVWSQSSGASGEAGSGGSGAVNKPSSVGLHGGAGGPGFIVITQFFG